MEAAPRRAGPGGARSGRSRRPGRAVGSGGCPESCTECASRAAAVTGHAALRRPTRSRRWSRRGVSGARRAALARPPAAAVRANSADWTAQTPSTPRCGIQARPTRLRAMRGPWWTRTGRTDLLHHRPGCRCLDQPTTLRHITVQRTILQRTTLRRTTLPTSA